MKKFLTCHPAVTFACMFISALLFGLSSYNLFSLLKANVDLVIEHGMMALLDGAFMEIIQLFVYGLISLVFYIVFKACEKLMVEYVTSK